jgi:hypothetical protein
MLTNKRYKLEILGNGFFAGEVEGSTADAEWIKSDFVSPISVQHRVPVPNLGVEGTVTIELSQMEFMKSAKFHRWAAKWWFSVQVEPDGCVYLYGYETQNSSGPCTAILLKYKVL